MISPFHCMMMFHDNKAALISAERSGENTRETNRCCKHHLHKSTFNNMFTSQRIDLFECIYLPRGNLIGIERLCCESRSQESSLPDWQTPPEYEAFRQDEETLSHKHEISQRSRYVRKNVQSFNVHSGDDCQDNVTVQVKTVATNCASPIQI